VRQFASVILDVDSTVSTIEGIDWLAALRAPAIAEQVAQLTTDAMESRVPIDAVYGRRLTLIAPSRREIAALSAAYIDTVVPGARDAISAWTRAGVRVVLVSGGLRDAILPLASWLGVPAVDVHAVDVDYGAEHDTVEGLADNAPLARRGGKPAVVQALALPRPILACGDGATDAELVPVVDRFVAFTGVVSRPAVVAAAAGVAPTFAALTSMILGPDAD
jgi:phosphoserine phosphatase